MYGKGDGRSWNRKDWLRQEYKKTVCRESFLPGKAGFSGMAEMTQGGPLGSTSTIMYYIYEQGFTNYNMGYASALAWIFFAIIMVVTLIQYRFRHEQGGE